MSETIIARIVRSVSAVTIVPVSPAIANVPTRDRNDQTKSAEISDSHRIVVIGSKPPLELVDELHRTSPQSPVSVEPFKLLIGRFGKQPFASTERFELKLTTPFLHQRSESFEVGRVL